MRKHGKRYQEVAKLVERGQVYEPEEAMELLKETAKVNFDPSVEAHIRLGVDPRHADQMVRGTVVAAARRGQDGPRARLRPGRQGARRPSTPAPTRSAARTSSSASRPAGSSSTSPSRRPT